MDLGSVPAELVYLTAKRVFGASKEQIPQNPESLEKALDRTFGASSVVIKRAISRKLAENFGLKQDSEARTMPDLIRELAADFSD